MIDLRLTRLEMLAAIGAPADLPPLKDPLAHELFAAPSVHLEVVGHSRDDLFPVLKVILGARLAAVPSARLTQDLLAPFKNALGNAYKRGNARDRSKSIGITIDSTPRGVVLAVTDQGPGFDVEATLQRYRSQDGYFHNIGAGFRAFDRTRASVSYADGGRTFLLCFRVDAGAEAAPAAPAAEPVRRLRVALETPDAARALSTAVHAPETLDALVITDLVWLESTAHDATLRCIVRGRVVGDVATTVLSGRRFDTAAAARSDFAVARALHVRLERGKVRIPEPIVCLEDDRVVFSAFDPWMDLWTYAAQRGEPFSLRRLGEHLGSCLRSLHGEVTGDIHADLEDWPAVVAAWKQRCEDAVRRVAVVLPEYHDPVVERVAALERRARQLTPPPPVFTHGAFGADVIHYGVDGRFYLSPFDRCRRSHPGLDVGGALADLLLLARLAPVAATPSLDADIRSAFLEAYTRGDTLAWRAEIPLFVLAALLSRIGAEQCSADEVRTLIELARDTRVA